MQRAEHTFVSGTLLKVPKGCTAATGCRAVARPGAKSCLGEWSRQACTVFVLLDYSLLQHHHELTHGEGRMGRVCWQPWLVRRRGASELFPELDVHPVMGC